ncbi:hypothetical protein [Streptomyces lancefieldiae]|uniref:Integral membrane protein n=1 Tax=Streptomyces lancefieldiae TaxID=3075520 RepID=A0ABU3AZR1_9ACTN|nr:hypothetical protein [Streptomyces sp. DSM 40712]MDT0615685.1 hypothetical protein [Streptomyces sp. DSM 40712]
MKYDVLQVLGVALLVLGGQGAIRQLVDHGNTGLLGWLPGGFTASIAVYLVAVTMGAVVAAWARGRAKAVGRRS